jgi:integrase
LVPPNDTGRASWRAKWRDPDSGRDKWLTLKSENKREREKWAVKQAEKLQGRRLQLRLGVGAPRVAIEAGETTLEEAKALFFADKKSVYAPSTVYTYSIAINEFIEYMRKRGVTRCAEVDLDLLMDWRAMVHGKPAVGGRKRRDKKTLDREVRNVGAMVRFLKKKRRQRNLFPRLTTDDLNDAFELIAPPTKKGDFLRYSEIRKTLESVIRHDADAGRRQSPDLAPFFLFALLAGARRHEILALRWKDIRLDEVDGRGDVIAEIDIPQETKTGDRILHLDVSPACRKLLVAMRLRSGGKGAVFPLREDQVKYDILRRTYGLPKNATLKTLRRTAETFAVNSTVMTLSQAMDFFGHDESTSLRHYRGRLPGIPRDLTDLESVMQITDLAEQIISSVSSPSSAGRASVSRIAASR